MLTIWWVLRPLGTQLFPFLASPANKLDDAEERRERSGEDPISYILFLLLRCFIRGKRRMECQICGEIRIWRARIICSNLLFINIIGEALLQTKVVAQAPFFVLPLPSKGSWKCFVVMRTKRLGIYKPPRVKNNIKQYL